jgi:L-fuculose-phosphate aldolase
LSTPLLISAEMVEIGRRLYERDHICGTEGNLSARLSDAKILITPSGVNKGFLKPDDMIICSAEGKKLEGTGEPSSEIRLHTAIYKWRKDVTAICHAHPVYATACSTAGLSLNRPVLPEIVGTLGVVPLAGYASPGSIDLPGSMADLIDRYDAFLLESHGVLTVGKSLEDAFNKIESTERLARILFLADQMGGAKLLSREETERLLKKAGRMNIMSELEFPPGN